MRRHYILLVGLILLICGCDGDDYANDPLIIIDPIVGVWEEVLDDSSQYDNIVWTFTADGLMTLNFDDNNLASGEWSKLNSPPDSYSLFFQQYPDAAKRVFFLTLNFSSDYDSLSIMGESTTFHWVRNRALVKIEY